MGYSILRTYKCPKCHAILKEIWRQEYSGGEGTKRPITSMPEKS